MSVLVLGSLGCSLGSLITGSAAPTPTPTKGLMATFTATPTGTPTSTPTDTPAATDTPPATPSTIPPSATPTQPNVTYVVQAGDTLSGIASRFSVTVQAIRDANGITGDIINVGTQLIIPVSGGPVSPPANPTATQAGTAPTATRPAAAPTATPRPPAPTATTRPPTATPQQYQYVYVEGSRQEQEKGCTELGVQGIVLDAGGRPIADKVTVKWQLDGSVMGYVVVNGNPVEQPGTFKFFIFQGPIYHGNKNSLLQIIASESNPTPLSAPLTWQIRDCIEGPESFVNVTFRHR